jgi:hypothetical protein
MVERTSPRNASPVTNEPAQTRHLKLSEHKHTVREAVMDPIAVFQPDRAAERLK